MSQTLCILFKLQVSENHHRLTQYQHFDQHLCYFYMYQAKMLCMV